MEINKKIIIPLNLLTNFEIRKYYPNDSRFNGTHWIALYVLNIEIIYFSSFEVQHVPKEIKIFIGSENIKKKHI